MKDEIKKIKIKTIGQLLDYVETEQKAKELIDYITNLQKYYNDNVNKYEELIVKYSNLQEKNERLKKLLNCKEYFSATMPENTEFVILTKNNYDRLQKDIQLDLIDFKLRIEKAIEYIKSYNIDFENTKFGEAPLNINDLQKLLNILQGVGKDE